MAITLPDLLVRPLEPAVEAELDAYERMVAERLTGHVDDDVFRVFRLSNGVYGQRQGGTNQMVRVRVPYGRLTAEQLEVLAHIADVYSRGWVHLTTRQNVQLHFVELSSTPEVLRLLAAVGLTTRESGGNSVRNVAGCHLAGACPLEALDITPWAEATTRWFLRNPISQRLPRKFKINFSGCTTDCGQAMFNDVGAVAVTRPLPDGTAEPGFRIFIAGGLGTTPRAAHALEQFTSREDLMPTIEAVLRIFDHYGNREQKLRARMKWLVDTMGIDRLRDLILDERRLLRASATWPGGIPEVVREIGDSPAGNATDRTRLHHGEPVEVPEPDPFRRWDRANVVRGVANGTVSAVAHAPLGDITASQLRALADMQRDFAADLRVTNRQNLVLRGLGEFDLRGVYDRLVDAGMAQPGAELARDVVSCPGSDTCRIGITQSRGLAEAIGRALDETGLAEVPGVRVNISGCSNACGHHHVADIGLFGSERRAHGRSAPGYKMLLGGHLGDLQAKFGKRAAKLPAKRVAEAVTRVVGRFAAERADGETFAGWLARSGGAAAVGADLADLAKLPAPTAAPDLYVDYGETGPYVVEVGDSECAT